MSTLDLVKASIPIFDGKPFRSFALAGVLRGKGEEITDKQAEQALRALLRNGQVGKGQFAGYYQEHKEEGE